MSVRPEDILINEKLRNDSKDSTVEFVEYINVPFLNVAANSDSEIADVESAANEDVEYLLDDSELNEHVIFVHEGKQYLIPRDQLGDKDNIIINSEISLDNIITGENEFPIEYADYDKANLEQSDESKTTLHTDVTDDLELSPIDDNIESVCDHFTLSSESPEMPKRKQYAILRDGQLFIQEGELTEDQFIESDQGTNFDAAFKNQMEDCLSADLEPEESPSFGIAGRNLITGQTISLDHFINKLTAKHGVSDISKTKIKKEKVEDAIVYQSSVAQKPTPKTGKRIVGKILEIKRPGQAAQAVAEEKPSKPNKVVPQSAGKRQKTITTIMPASTDVTEYMDFDDSIALTTERTTSTSRVDECEFSSDPVDSSILKTLTGLMDMESFAKYLINKNLFIKKIVKRLNSQSEQCVYKQITYYKGVMQRIETITHTNEVSHHWEFLQNTEIGDESEDMPIEEETEADNIDLTVINNDTQQIELSNDRSLKAEDTIEITNCGSISATSSKTKKNVKKTYKVEAESVTVHFNITEDENGSKRMKVIIPQMYEAGRFCAICNKMFRNSQQYRRHLKSAHTTNESRLHTCDLCSKKFGDASSLSRHRRIHNGDKNFQCNLCFKAFNTTGSLKRHITIHIPSLRPLQCLKCLQRFTDESSLKKHMLLHTGLKPFECNVCFKRFVHLGDLNFHLKIHDPLKQYCCDTCGKEFSRYSNLIRHLEIHRDNGNLFKCDICGCSYNFMSSLTRHIVNNHMKES